MKRFAFCVALFASLILVGCGAAPGSGTSVQSTGGSQPKALNTSVQASTISKENSKKGDSGWQLKKAASGHNLEGFASATSVTRGESIKFYVNTIYSKYTIDVYRMGWYGGTGGRRMMAGVVRHGTNQVLPTPDPNTGFAEAQWSDPYTLTIPNTSDPTDWCSGVYLAKLTANGEESYIPFVVRDDARRSNILMQITDSTYQAYNNYLGKSLYAGRNPDGIAARKVSYNRPYAAGAGSGMFFNWEYQMIRFLESEGVDVTYSDDVATHEHPSLLLNHDAFMNTGHDEYWTWQMRDAVENARNSGVNLAFLSANNCFWQIRLEPSTVDGTPDRTIVGYKESAATLDPYATDNDPSNDKYVTGLFYNVGRYEEDLVGLRYFGQVNSADMVVADGQSFAWAQTGLTAGAVIPGVIGGELDRATPHSPANLQIIAHSPVVTLSGYSGYTDMASFISSSGAITISAGNFTFSYGLDDFSLGTRPSVANAATKQMMRNIVLRLRQHP